MIHCISLMGVCSVKDCLDLARISYDKQDYYHTVMWMEHAMQQLQHGTENITEPFYSRTHALILDYLAFSTFQVAVLSLYRLPHLLKKLTYIKNKKFTQKVKSYLRSASTYC